MFWEYDSRLGRRRNIDPVDKPWESSYAAFLGNPIRVIDPNGDDGYVDEDGNYLGNEGANKEGESYQTVRVIQKDKWTSLVGDNTEFSEDLITDLRSSDNSTELSSYYKGINISSDVKKQLKESGVAVNYVSVMTEWVRNESDNTIFVKPEEGSEPVEIKPNTSLYAPIDGVAAPHVKKDQVYKVSDGLTTKVTNKEVDPSVLLTDDGIGVLKATLGYWIKAGWLEKAPDSGWDKIFEKSKSK
ncbi:MAG: hypothetical protein H6581_31460 [Bacteroidia bacterium]|nr:hypothetical protein [Bacteroidia bacterium]